MASSRLGLSPQHPVFFVKAQVSVVISKILHGRKIFFLPRRWKWSKWSVPFDGCHFCLSNAQDSVWPMWNYWLVLCSGDLVIIGWLNSRIPSGVVVRDLRSYSNPLRRALYSGLTLKETRFDCKKLALDIIQIPWLRLIPKKHLR